MTKFAILAALVLVLAGTAGATPGGGDTAGAVYTLSNAAAGNSVLVFARGHDGTLTPAGSYPTGGLGTGSGLGSQGALARDGKWLVGVDAGSNQIAAFRVKHNTLQLTSHVASGGAMPISVTVHDGLVYVLNAGGTANITGFTFHSGTLEPLAGSSRPLSTASPGPAQVEFTPDGRVLVVTEKDTNKIDTYVVGADGLTTGPHVQASAGATPSASSSTSTET